jgi:hypothetical protein
MWFTPARELEELFDSFTAPEETEWMILVNAINELIQPTTRHDQLDRLVDKLTDSAYAEGSGIVKSKDELSKEAQEFANIYLSTKTHAQPQQIESARRVHVTQTYTPMDRQPIKRHSCISNASNVPSRQSATLQNQDAI